MKQPRRLQRTQQAATALAEAGRADLPQSPTFRKAFIQGYMEGRTSHARWYNGSNA